MPLLSASPAFRNLFRNRVNVIPPRVYRRTRATTTARYSRRRLSTTQRALYTPRVGPARGNSPELFIQFVSRVFAFYFIFFPVTAASSSSRRNRFPVEIPSFLVPVSLTTTFVLDETPRTRLHPSRNIVLFLTLIPQITPNLEDQQRLILLI